MKSATLALAIMLATAAAGNLAFAGERAGKGQAQERLKAADTNGDGQLTRDEAKALPKLAAKFDQIDADKNGLVSFQEIQAVHAQGKRNHFERLDTDRDGRISRVEAERAPKMAEHFNQLDANGDGFVTKEEMQAKRGKQQVAS